MVSGARLASVTARAILSRPITAVVINSPGMPWSAKTSASARRAAQQPMAPASTSARATAGHLWVLPCGRKPLPRTRRCAAMVAMFDSKASRSSSRAGVGRSPRNCIERECYHCFRRRLQNLPPRSALTASPNIRHQVLSVRLVVALANFLEPNPVAVVIPRAVRLRVHLLRCRCTRFAGGDQRPAGDSDQEECGWRPGVREYWVVDPASDCISVYRLEKPGRFRVPPSSLRPAGLLLSGTQPERSGTCHRRPVPA